MKAFLVVYEYRFSYVADDGDRYVESARDSKKICCQRQDVDRQLIELVKEDITVNGTEHLESLEIISCHEQD